DSARQRLSRVETLAAKGPPDAEAALAVARAALDAQEFAAARKALAPYTATPRKRVAALMAELEMAQGDEGRAREWMARALNARARAQRGARPARARGRVGARPRAPARAGERAARRLRGEGPARGRGPRHSDRAPRRGAAAPACCAARRC